MKVNFIIDDNQFYFSNYYVFHKNEKHIIGRDLKFETEEDSFEFYIKTAWMKSKSYVLNENSNYLITVGNLITKTLYIKLVLAFIILLSLTLYFDNDFFWNLTTIMCIGWGFFQLYLYTFGVNHFIKVKIENKKLNP